MTRTRRWRRTTSSSPAFRCSASATACSCWPISSAAESRPPPEREYGPAADSTWAMRLRSSADLPGDPAGVDEPRRQRQRAACRLQASGQLRQRSLRRHRRRPRPLSASSSTRRSCTRLRAQQILRELPFQASAGCEGGWTREVDRRSSNRAGARVRSATAARSAPSPAASIPRSRRPSRYAAIGDQPDLRLRRQRRHAQRRAGAGAGDLRAQPGHQARLRRRRRRASSPSLRASPTRRPSARRIGETFVRVFEETRPSSATSTSWSRARPTRTWSRAARPLRRAPLRA